MNLINKYVVIHYKDVLSREAQKIVGMVAEVGPWYLEIWALDDDKSIACRRIILASQIRKIEFYEEKEDMEDKEAQEGRYQDNPESPKTEAED